jgi:hypothetical protein
MLPQLAHFAGLYDPIMVHDAITGAVFRDACRDSCPTMREIG